MNANATRLMKVSDLQFDRKNPRLAEFSLTDDSEESEVMEILWEAMDVEELTMSIAASGFFPHEPVIVAKENGKHVVIEGNRRLAAVKLLLNPNLVPGLAENIRDIGEDAKEALKEIPAISGTRENAWRYLGFKHVNGPAKWSSYAKSRYIADVHKNFGIKLEDIAKQIGDTHKTVQRLFRGLMVIEQAERMKVFNREDRWRNHFAFSHLYTGLEYPAISAFIGLQSVTDEDSDPVPLEKKEELREVCLWIYGSRKYDIPPVVKTQNPHLRRLEAVVGNIEALAALRDGIDLDVAYELTRPSSTVFEESLLASKRNLQKARSVLSIGYDGSDKLLGIADEVAEVAEDLYKEMQRKRKPGKNKRRRGGG